MPHDSHTHTASGGPGRLSPADARKITGAATTLSVGIALTLVTAKLIAWWFSGSIALLASLADSGLDLAASLTTFFAVRYAASPADREHRFGHGKAEAFASFLQALFITLSAAWLLYEAGQRMIDPEPIQHGGWALGVMGLSMVLTTLLIWAQSRAIKKTGSVAVTGDRAHYVADLAANLAVIAGITLTAFFAVGRADPAIAIVVALWLFWSAWGVARGALDHLLDRELPDEERAKIKAIAMQDPKMLDVHQLRTRAAGPLVHIQFHADLNPDLTLDAAHQILVACERRLMAEYPAADILIHPDPHGRAEPHGSDFFRAESDPADESA
mgnify:CR=1 FL=1|tara:strand:+ start:491 stop:1474 length:984 start_codon:yes stop_codon:yes gene_type:complete